MSDSLVYIVDDDVSVRDSLSLLLTFNGFRTRQFASAEDFLAAWQPDWDGCLLLDLRMPGMNGLVLQEALNERGAKLPIIFLSGHGDISHARSALKAGSVDFLEKPVNHEALLQALTEALKRQAEVREEATQLADLRGRLARLSDRERQVMERVVAGRLNREIAAELGISPRTVEVFKARMMEKMQARNLPELVKLVMIISSLSGS